MVKDTVSQLSIPQIFIGKRFWTAVIGLVFMVLVGLEPRLADSADLLQGASLAIISLLITSFTGQDWIVAKAQGASKYQLRSGSFSGELLATMEPIQQSAKG